MKQSRQYLKERIEFPILIAFVVFFIGYLSKKWEAKNAIIVAKHQIIENIKKDGTDSAIIEGNKALKALESEKGLDSLINQIR